MRYWWVNQNQTYKFEIPGGFLWSPKTRADGGSNYFYNTMEQVRTGDMVFSYSGTYIKAVGIVKNEAKTARKPNFQSAGSNWAKEGWYVPVDFTEMNAQFRPKEFIESIRPLLADKYAPLQRNGNGLQGVYLTEISRELAKLLMKLLLIDLDLLEGTNQEGLNAKNAETPEVDIEERRNSGYL